MLAAVAALVIRPFERSSVMHVATPRIGIAALAVVAAAAVTFGPILFSGAKRPLPKLHPEVSIAQLRTDETVEIAPAPAGGKAQDTVTVQASR
jgi:hypothetical protein